MKTSVATVSIGGTLTEKLEAIAAAGFDGVEIFEQDLLTFDGSPRDVARIAGDLGLAITLFQPFRDFEGLPEPYRARAFRRAERKFDLMEELGTDLVLVCSSVHPESLGGIDRIADDFRELGERAAARGLRVGYEALAWGKHISDHRDAWEVVRRADHPNVGLILDSFHTLARKIDPKSIRSIPGDRIFFVQLADAPLIDMDLLYWSRHFRNMPGEGDLDVTGFMRAVAATGYPGPLSLEIFNDQFRGGRPSLVAGDGYRSLVNLMDDVRRAEPALKVDLAPMPARVRADGVEFIEFASDADGARTLGTLLRTLGFRQTGRHISKDLTLWQQGDIRIVLNIENEGFARSAFVTHGTSICDIGLHVADAGATLERARILGASVFSQPRDTGQIDIPAIRGVGGGVMHFLDDGPELSRVWETEFVGADEGRIPDAGGKDAGLTRIDHLAQTMAYDEMLSWSLFYTSIFDAGKTPMVDVADPGGLVRSQAIEGRGGLRLTLNGAETHRTFAGRYLAETFGSAVQHVAFASDDIFATAERLAASGFEALPIGGNYYADLAARFDLESEEVERMLRFCILYDEDAQGRFFQLYSKSIGAGFFFEIIQRQDGYNGYGAPNAPFRIAAQARLGRGADIPLR